MAAPAARRRPFLMASLGVLLAWSTVLGAAAATGFIVIFLAWPIYAIHLMLSGIVAFVAVGLVARLWRGMGKWTVLAAAAVLTVALFALLPITLALNNGDRAESGTIQLA